MRVRALYNDGHSAVSHRVTVAVDASGLAIMAADERKISMWPAAGLELVERPIGRSPFRLGCGGAAPRLTFAASVIESFGEYYPGLELRHAPGMRAWLQMVGWAAGALMFSIAGWLLAAPVLAQAVAAMVPDSAKARLGIQLAGQAVASIAERDGRSYDDMFCYDEASAASLQRLFAILAQGQAADVRFGLLAIDSAQPELFALPGGQIVMSGALPDQAGGAEALAGLMAHEIGHIARDHPTQTLLLRDPVAVLFSLLPPDGSSAAFDASLANQFLRHGYRDSKEEEVEEFALNLLNGIGVVAEPYAVYRAAGVDASDVPADPVTRMHPVTEDSAAMLQEGGVGRLLALDPDQWQALRQLCR